MEEAKRAGLTKSIGISNSGTPEIEEVLSAAEIIPAVNQVGVYPETNFRCLINPGADTDRVPSVLPNGPRADS